MNITRAVLLALAVLPSISYAEDESQKLEEIEVTAQHRDSFTSKSVQVGTFRDLDPLEVPLTVNIVTRELMDAQAATGLFDALKNTAGVTRSQINGSTYDNIAIRGILVENRGNYRLNGSLPIINLIDTPLENKERVEVLKGASSLYYGLVPPSGIINLVTKRAGEKEVKSLTMTGNEYGAASIHLDYGKRFGDQNQYGARVNIVTGEEEIGVDNYTGHRALGAAALDWRVNDKLSFKLDLEHYRKDVSEQAAIALPAAQNGRIVLPSTPPADRNLAGRWQRYDAEANNILFRTDYAINDNWGLLFEAGKAETDRDRKFSSFSFGPNGLATGDGQLQIFYTRNQQFENTNYRSELFGIVETGFIVHQLSVGYTSNEREGKTPIRGTQSIAQNFYEPRDIPVIASGPYLRLSDQTISDRGWYVYDRMLLGERWQLMLGARHSDYVTDSVTITNAGSRSATRFSTEEITPTVSVLYKLQPNTSLYASYIEGLEDSGQAPANRANAGELLDPATSRQRELGLKTQVFNNFLLQLAYFDIERAAAYTDPLTNIFGVNGDANYRGLELSATGEITSNLSVAASAVLMNAELNTPDSSTDGNVPEGTPEQTASLFGEYKLDMVPGLFLSAGLFYTGDQSVDALNQAEVGGYTIGTVGARYVTRFGKERTTFQLVVDNVTDKNYFSTAGNGFLGVGRPRTLKGTVRVDF